MFYLVAPAGTPITTSELCRILRRRWSMRANDDEFARRLKRLSGVSHCRLVNSGRTAMVLGLSALARMAPKRKEVVVPAYTCYSVAAAVVRCGLRLRLVDIDPATMDYDYTALKALDLSGVLAVVGCNLFGLPSDWNRLRQVSEGSGAYLVDDSAQTMGAEYEGQPLGGLGDVGFYSFGRGKNLSTFSGGVLLTSNDEIARSVDEAIADMSRSSLIEDMSVFARLTAYSLLLRPWMYWLPDSLPFLRLGQTEFDPEFTTGRLSMLQTGAGAVLFDNLKRLETVRIDRSSRMASALLKTGRYLVPGFDADNVLAYLRLPVLAESKAARDEAIAQLRKNHIMASTMYPSTLRCIEGIESHLADTTDDYPGAQTVVERLFTLPTHPYVSDRDVETIVKCLTAESRD